uniref:Predicted Peptidoglycan domain-containing protein n=1 Tax=Candidatus Kentrum sp. DK TaxID=2126562 RepID=A0A450RV69_9GAMM|nr:MAG: Predicted Peptidoglycan domain-containing protein [Candidatus Kentron sp. DK]
MNKNFEDALGHVLVHEGGYVDHPKDPGGATNRGVTLATFQRFYGEGKGKEDLKAITGEQLRHIYRSGYWDKCRCDELPDGVDYVVFDQAVNSGPGRSAKWLQSAVKVPVDGGIGPRTLKAVNDSAYARTVETMCDERLGFMKRIRNGQLWAVFGKGWQRRVDGVRVHGLVLATGGAANDDGEIVPSVDYEIIGLGSRGEWVRKLQEELEIGADGIFGAGTETALKAFQIDAGLEADGIVGRNTWRALGLIA